jgi:hypothetical protein
MWNEISPVERCVGWCVGWCVGLTRGGMAGKRNLGLGSLGTLLLLLCHLAPHVLCTLIIDEDFDNLDIWNQDKSGTTATIKIVDSTFPGTQTMLSTNVSYCGNDSCYRAEITTPPSMRPSVISGTSGLIHFVLPSEALR